METVLGLYEVADFHRFQGECRLLERRDHLTANDVFVNTAFVLRARIVGVLLGERGEIAAGLLTCFRISLALASSFGNSSFGFSLVLIRMCRTFTLSGVRYRSMFWLYAARRSASLTSMPAPILASSATSRWKDRFSGVRNSLLVLLVKRLHFVRRRR